VAACLCDSPRRLRHTGFIDIRQGHDHAPTGEKHRRGLTNATARARYDRNLSLFYFHLPLASSYAIKNSRRSD
jgi:hypothetical protein